MNPLIINFFTLFFLFIIPHKYYVSTTLMDFDNKTKSLEITLKVFYDDLEKDLKLDSNKVDYIKDYDYLNEIYKPYLDQNFQINFDNEAILIVNGIGKKSNEIEKSIIDSYNNKITDEFIEPIVIVDNKNLPLAKIEDNDVVIFFNFRTDRGRQLTEVLSQNDFNDFSMKKLNLKFLTMTNYNDEYKNIDCIYENENLSQTLGEVLEQNKRTQIRIAETEKYPHVTFFFNGGKESPFKNETRIMCPSPKVATYDLKPEMSAYEIKDSIIPEINSNSADFICLNFANPDMVGHTGNFDAAVKACETVDICLKDIVESSINNNYSIIIIADHGNSDVMKNNDGSPNTAHSTNPVPIIVIDSKTDKVNDGILADIAPTILNIMDIDIPEKMSGKILIWKI